MFPFHHKAASLAFSFALLCAHRAPADALNVVATLPDLGSLVAIVGGDDVSVTVLGRGREDPHFIDPKPSFIRVLHDARLLVHTGLDLEIGWVPPLLRKARNSGIQPGAPGNLDASRGIALMNVATGRVDRSQGDVHPNGNPHYLLDPVNGLHVAAALRDRLSELEPQRAEAFGGRYQAFEERLIAALVGDAMAGALGVRPIADAALAGDLDPLLGTAPPDAPLAGWLGLMRAHRGAAVLADHDLWPYFARRFHIEVAALLEPVPGIAPTSRHLVQLATRMNRDHIGVILSAAYFHPRYAVKLATAADARIVEMANQVGAIAGVDDYLAMTDWNVRKLADAL